MTTATVEKKAKTKVKTTHVALILDKSGSMDSCREQAIEGYNSQVETLQKAATSTNQVKVTRVLFDTAFEIGEVDQDIHDVRKLTHSQYKPGGCTALYDAVGKAIELLKPVKLGKKDAVLFIIVSDGQENSSTLYTSEQISELITGLEKTDHWTFTYMGSNVDLKEVARRTGIRSGNMANYTSTPSGTSSAVTTMSSSTSAYMNERGAGHTSSPSFYSESGVPLEVSENLSDEEEERLKNRKGRTGKSDNS